LAKYAPVGKPAAWPVEFVGRKGAVRRCRHGATCPRLAQVNWKGEKDMLTDPLAFVVKGPGQVVPFERAIINRVIFAAQERWVA